MPVTLAVFVAMSVNLDTLLGRKLNLNVCVSLSTVGYNLLQCPEWREPSCEDVDAFTDKFIDSDTPMRCTMQLHATSRWPQLWNKVRQRIEVKILALKKSYDELDTDHQVAAMVLHRHENSGGDRAVRKKLKAHLYGIGNRRFRGPALKTSSSCCFYGCV